MDGARQNRLTAAETILAVLALAVSLALAPIFLWMPMYSGESTSVDENGTITNVTTGSMSLTDMNGRWVLIYGVAVLLVVLVIIALLWFRRPESGPGAVAWTLFGLLAAFTLLGAMSIGMFLLPLTGLLLALCVVRQSRASSLRATAGR